PQDRRLRRDALEVGQLERAHDLKGVDHRLRAARRRRVDALRHGWWRRDREQQDNEADTRQRQGLLLRVVTAKPMIACRTVYHGSNWQVGRCLNIFRSCAAESSRAADRCDTRLSTVS